MSSLHWRVLCGNRDYRGGGPALEWSFTGDDDTWTPVAVFAHSDQAMAAKAEVERYAGEEYAMRAGMEAKPTAGAFAALADWLREHGRDGEADMAAKYFEAVARRRYSRNACRVRSRTPARGSPCPSRLMVPWTYRAACLARR